MVKRVKKKKGANTKITEGNCKQKLFEYAVRHYPQEMENASLECPYNLEELDSEFAFKELAEWFTSERIQPSTGKTVVREFVENYEKDMEPGLKEKLLQLETMFYGEFEVIATDDTQVILAAITSGERYKVKLFEENIAAYRLEELFEGEYIPGEMFTDLRGLFALNRATRR